MRAWEFLVSANVLYAYSLAPVIWKFLDGKLKNEKAFALAYVTGFHLVLAAYLLQYLMLEPFVLISYVTMLIFAVKKVEVVKKPYPYLLWSLLLSAQTLGW